MADYCDQSAATTDYDLSVAMRNVQAKASTMRGPERCHRCKGANDRAREGWAICSACAEEMREAT